MNFCQRKGKIHARFSHTVTLTSLPPTLLFALSKQVMEIWGIHYIVYLFVSLEISLQRSEKYSVKFSYRVYTEKVNRIVPNLQKYAIKIYQE